MLTATTDNRLDFETAADFLGHLQLPGSQSERQKIVTNGLADLHRNHCRLIGIDAICTVNDSLYHDVFLPAWEAKEYQPLTIKIDITCLSDDELASEFGGDLPAIDGFHDHPVFGRCRCDSLMTVEISGRKVLVMEFEAGRLPPATHCKPWERPGRECDRDE